MTDWIEITALVAGPVIAVGLTLWREQARQDREQKLTIMRQLLLTRNSAEDPAFTAAIRLIPIEYGKVGKVMAAWENFEHAAGQQQASKQLIDELIKEMMLHLGYGDRAASLAARTDYISTGFADQRRLVDGVLKGVVSIAKASRQSAQAANIMAEHVTGKSPPPLADE